MSSAARRAAASPSPPPPPAAARPRTLTLTRLGTIGHPPTVSRPPAVACLREIEIARDPRHDGERLRGVEVIVHGGPKATPRGGATARAVRLDRQVRRSSWFSRSRPAPLQSAV